VLPAGSDGLELAAMEKFAKVEALSLVLGYSDATEEALFAADVPLHLLVFHAAPVEGTAALQAAAEKLRGEVVVATVEAKKYADAASFFDAGGKGGLTLPVAVAYSLANGTKFASADLSADGLVAFVRAVQSGTQPQHLRSAAAPKVAARGEPTELVGSTYAGVVFDSEKDVMVQFYSTSCGHCRKFAPVYAELAAKLADDDAIVVAQIDGAANDVPGFLPEGYPTILFFPKSNKKGVEYDGSRDLHDMEQFIADVRAGREHIGGLSDQQEAADAEMADAKVEL